MLVPPGTAEPTTWTLQEIRHTNKAPVLLEQLRSVTPTRHASELSNNSSDTSFSPSTVSTSGSTSTRATTAVLSEANDSEQAIARLEGKVAIVAKAHALIQLDVSNLKNSAHDARIAAVFREWDRVSHDLKTVKEGVEVRDGDLLVDSEH